MADWWYIPNISGHEPIRPPPKTKLLIGRNHSNRVEGSPKRFTTEHVTWWSDEDQCFVRIIPDLFQLTTPFFFHQWRLFDE